MSGELCEAWLESARAKLEPTQADRNAISRSQRHLRMLLSDGRFGGRILDSFLHGSYARRTAIRPIDDVDIILLIDPEAWPPVFMSSYPDPATVIDSLRRAVVYRYKLSSVRTQRRSVRLKMEHLNVDIVPAINTGSHGDGIVLVPDREADEWRPSGPLIHQRFAFDVNGATGKAALPLIKLLKGWNNGLSQNARIRSFALEVATLRFLAVNPPRSLAHGMHLALDFLRWLAGLDQEFRWHGPEAVRPTSFWGPAVIDDPSGLGGNVADGIEEERWALFGQKATAALNHLQAATRARTAASAIEHLNAMRIY